MATITDPCPVCAVLGDSVEIENAQEPTELDTAEFFPEGVERLTIPNLRLEAHYRFRSERLLKCPVCLSYFRYRQWAPGGSEDVMRTYVHESITRLGALDVHKELHGALYQASRRADEYGGAFREEYAETAVGVQEELAALRPRCREVIAEALSSLEDKHAYSRALEVEARRFYPVVAERLVAEAREREKEVAVYHAEILAEYLELCGEEPVEAELPDRLRGLLSDEDERVREFVQGALSRLLRCAGDS